MLYAKRVQCSARTHRYSLIIIIFSVIISDVKKPVLRLLAPMAIIAITLTTTACGADSSPFINTPHNLAYPAQGYVSGIENTGENASARCAADSATVIVVPDGTTTFDTFTRIHSEWRSETIIVSSDAGFETFTAGIVIAEDGTRVPFSMQVDGFDRRARTFGIDAERDFMHMTGDSRIIGMELCATTGT